MKFYPSCLLMLAMIVVPAAKGDGVPDLIGRAEKGEATAQMELAGIYLKGEGVTRDVAEAVKWLSKAAEMGNSDAQVKLGGIYLGGKGVLKNSKEAAKWFMMSAERGNAAAQCQIGRMHVTGAGVPKNALEAYKWANLAAAQGDAAAVKVVAFLSVRMTPLQIAEGKQRSLNFLEEKMVRQSPDLPPDSPPMPVELLPLFTPE